MILLFISLFTAINKIDSPYFKNINIISDLVDGDTSIKKVKQTQNVLVNDLKIFDSKQKTLLTNFSIDSNDIPLMPFLQKIKSLQKSKKGKIRIAYLGDSIIEGDLISQTLRKLLQERFGGSGVGFITITSVVSNFRTTVNHTFSSKWKESNFRTKTTTTPLFLSGKVFFANGYNWSEITDKTTTAFTNKYIYTGYKPTTGQIIINKNYQSIFAKNIFNKIKVDSGTTHKLKIESSDPYFPIYGVSYESENGIFVDNLSFRGSGGFEFNNADLNFLQSINEVEPYDLIILQYGANTITNGNQVNFDWYYKSMINSLDKLKKGFPNATFLIMSATDRAFKYPDGIYTAKGLPELIETQRKLAFENNFCFYNTFESMGGLNSIVNWSNNTPALAAKDYTHLSVNGAENLGKTFFNEIMKNYTRLK